VTKGSSLAFVGRPIEGLATLRAGQEVAEAAGLPLTVLRAMNNRNFVNGSRDPRAVLQTARDGAALSRRIGARTWLAGAVQAVGGSALRTGGWDEGIAGLEATLAEGFEGTDRMQLLESLTTFRAYRGESVAEAVAEFPSLLGDNADPQMSSLVESIAAVAAFGEGRYAEARALAHRSLEINEGGALAILPFAGRAAVWLRDAAAVRADLDALVALRLHGAALDADLATLRAGAAALEGRTGEALGLYREALQAWRDLGLAWDEALTGLDMAHVLDPSDPDVVAAAEMSRATLARLGAAPFLAELDRALADRRAPAPGS